MTAAHTVRSVQVITPARLVWCTSHMQGLGAAAALKALPVATVASDGVDGGTRWSKTMGLAARDAALLAGAASNCHSDKFCCLVAYGVMGGVAVDGATKPLMPLEIVLTRRAMGPWHCQTAPGSMPAWSKPDQHNTHDWSWRIVHGT